MRRRRHHHQHGIAVAASCAACAHLIGGPPAEDGIRMAIVCERDAAGLVALGWVRTADPDGGADDVACVHYHAALWEDGHDGCCGLDGDRER